MAVKPPTTTPEAPADKPSEKKPDRFRPEMPQIPGVSQGSYQPKHGSGGADLQPLLQIGGIAMAVALLGGSIYWWAMNKSHEAAKSPAAVPDAAEQTTPPPLLPDSIAAVQDGPTIAATVDELSKPWAAKKFVYTNPITHEKTNAMVIRLPGGELWGFSLKVPIGNCQLEFITDFASIAARYGYKATHPMVVNPCDRTLYDPLKIGALGGNTWARGEIVQGSALRPPISIDVKVSGRSILADKIE